MSDVFENIVGQPEVRSFLRSACNSGRISHAYLFIGPAGSGKTDAAYSLAQAIMCKHGGCTTCDTCRHIKRKTHPDVRIFEPEGTQSYLINQIRDIVSDCALTPIQSEKKVYIIKHAEALSASCANAFLKTLEEPPSSVVFILLGRTVKSVIPTVVSRCQIVAFRHIPIEEAAGIVAQHTGVRFEKALVAAYACDGSIGLAVKFCNSNECFAFRSAILEALDTLADTDMWDVLKKSNDIVAMAKIPLNLQKQEPEDLIDLDSDFLSPAAKKQLEAKNKRYMSSKNIQSLMQICAVTKTWLHDVLMMCVDKDPFVINYDIKSKIQSIACSVNEARVGSAYAVVRECEGYIKANVNPQNCIDVMLLGIKDRLFSK